MSAESITESMTDELPVWVVNGSNWHVNVGLDEMNAGLPKVMQVWEAASRALRTVKGLDERYVLVMDEGETQPFLGTHLIVHLLNDNPTDREKAFTPMTHVALANEGFYKESDAMAKVLQAEVAAIEAEFHQNEGAIKKLLKQAKAKKPLKKAPKKVPRKRK